VSVAGMLGLGLGLETQDLGLVPCGIVNTTAV